MHRGAGNAFKLTAVGEGAAYHSDVRTRTGVRRSSGQSRFALC